MGNLFFPINEVFETLQAEGTRTGTPSIFMRLQGCGVACPWCDTKHTWALDPSRRISAEEMLAKEADAPTYAEMTAAELAQVARGLESRHVVLTGGEPCDYDLDALTDALLREGKSVQVETSGTAPVRVLPLVWVTCSPKIGMPGGLGVLPGAVRRADEIKMPVGRPRDIETLVTLLEETGASAPVFLQPLSTSEKATRLCIEEARRRGWRVSLQVHKFCGLR